MDRALDDESWTLVSPPKNKSTVGTKWVYKNKLYEQGKVIRNMIRSYPGKSMIVSEFESSRGMTRINKRRTQNKTEMEDTTI